MPQRVLPEGRRERKKRELRGRIYEAARRLFVRQGFEATTVTQIAAAADVAPATFFLHFPNKAAVLAELTGEVSGHLRALVAEQLARRVAAQERIRGFAQRVAAEVSPARGLAREVLLELMRSRAEPGVDVPYLSPVHEPFAEIIRAGQAAGEVRTDFDAAFLGEMALGALNVAIVHWMQDPSFPLEDWLRRAAEFVGQALEPRPTPQRRSPPRPPARRPRGRGKS
jgi:AcrR family transcriptional regulator